MAGPNPVLTHYYGNEELYQEKLAAEKLSAMTSLASIAAQTGADMAKRAGIVGGALKGLVKSPTARGVVAGGALLGGGLLAAKAMKAVPDAMERESGPRRFGPGRFGYNPPMGINSYGQPQSNTPLM